ncbi:MAG TPA: ribonuclease Z [Flavobacterium sp.]|jgi:hypothetical protein
MKVEEKGHTIIIRDTQGNTSELLEKLIHEYKSFENHNLVVDISHDAGATLATISKFIPLSKQHKKKKKSFVLVTADIDFNAIPASLIVVPSQLEAHDIIEMEEIERDLGF